MCHYCGCRDMPLLRDYIAEHESVTALAYGVVRAIDGGDLDEAQSGISRMASELQSHWQGEENGIFAVMVGEAEYADHIVPLVSEHRELADLLANADVSDPVDQQRIRDAVPELREHISKEEDGLFPASLTSLKGSDWDTAIAAWHAAHPGKRLINE